ncbi:beta galactosidase jelly roll domain-containing protein [Pendulispora rubella]|uniref:beta galactosidase jelly roll domain-containing protein n=1 Tax=Pendulispora rubella TaxID=2741070 RepID=UPI00374E0292
MGCSTPRRRRPTPPRNTGGTIRSKCSTTSISERGRYNINPGGRYRAHVQARGAETGVSLSATTGNQGKCAAWLNGVYLGANGNGARTFTIPAGALRPNADNVLAVLVENMGHNQDWLHNDSHKEPRGLTSASLVGCGTAALAWKIQGNLGGEDLADPVRGPLNNGGLFGERAGWSLPGYPDRDWAKTTLPATEPTPGVSRYRTDFHLNVPPGPETSIGLRITDDPKRKYRLQIFVNGWNIGRYINDVGPQRVFVIPTGLLRTRGSNTLAVASWGDDDGTGGLGQVSLVNLQ